jgi:peptidyl-dipeptidase Dcp
VAGHYLARSLIVPFLTFSQRRDLREQAWRAWVARGEHDGPHDNRVVALEILALRREQAAAHGYACYADYALADTMARSQNRVRALLDEVWEKALVALQRERALLVAARDAGGARDAIEPWDWRYWAEHVRRDKFALDEAQVKPYFALPAMVQAAFDCATRLFGLRFEPRDDVQAYHADVRAFEVTDAAGHKVGLFLQDNFARPGKRSGAWMSVLRWQHRNGFESRPVILNNNNFAKGGAGSPTLLSIDDVRTLFHEFGHGLHGLLSDVDYERLSGTQVLRDFVELPSQLFEHWITEPAVLRKPQGTGRAGADSRCAHRAHAGCTPIRPGLRDRAPHAAHCSTWPPPASIRSKTSSSSSAGCWPSAACRATWV